MKTTKPMFDEANPEAKMKEQLTNNIPSEMERIERKHKRQLRFVNIAIFIIQGAMIFIFAFLLLVIAKMIWEVIKINF
jgi:hypothetical protein